MSERRGIIAIGNLLVDQSMCCAEYPRESMLTQISSVGKSCGGGCTNVLFDLAQMDASLPLELSGIIGRDEYGEFILQEAARHKIDTRRVQISLEDATSFTYVMVNNQNGYRTFFHHMGANHHLGVENFCRIESQARIAHVAYLLLLPELEKEDSVWKTTGAKAMAELQNQGFEVSLDLVSAPETDRYTRWVKPVLPFVDYLIINDEESRRLSQRDDNDFIAQAHDLLSMGVRKLVCIHYPEGAIAVDSSGAFSEAPAYHVQPKDVVSTLGAGDAFCAGMLYGIHEKWSMHDTLHLACASAHFNLFNISSTEGARALPELTEFILTMEELA